MREIKQGIYLQQVTTKIGTGVTSSNREVKNYYILRPTGNGAEAFLLTDNLELTGLREHLSLAELEDFYYQGELHERFALLAQGLGPAPDGSPPPPPPTAQQAVTEPTPPTPKATQHQQPPRSKRSTPWWESTRDGAGKLLGKK